MPTDAKDTQLRLTGPASSFLRADCSNWPKGGALQSWGVSNGCLSLGSDLGNLEQFRLVVMIEGERVLFVYVNAVIKTHIDLALP
eukprot:m.454711 g.454711  ORF g.454711 m.454711 type:complete len:85 (+) comp20728_c0_seq1:3958-4212(+)